MVQQWQAAVLAAVAADGSSGYALADRALHLHFVLRTYGSGIALVACAASHMSEQCGAAEAWVGNHS